MKFNVVRAWKDEAYRQSLSKRQRERLPANPAGELTETELELVTGGDGSGGGNGGGIQPVAPAITHHGAFHGSAGAASSSASSTERIITSFSVVCTIDVFSVSLHVLNVENLISIANSERLICAHIGG